MSRRVDFYDFTLKQVKRKDAIGALSRFVKKQKEWPQPGGYPAELEIVLAELGAPIEVVAAARVLCDEYLFHLQSQ